AGQAGDARGQAREREVGASVVAREDELPGGRGGRARVDHRGRDVVTGGRVDRGRDAVQAVRARDDVDAVGRAVVREVNRPRAEPGRGRIGDAGEGVAVGR